MLIASPQGACDVLSSYLIAIAPSFPQRKACKKPGMVHFYPAREEGVVIPGYTIGMKTAISVPDETYERASRRAGDLGMSRSEFFARAAERYLDELDAQSLTTQIDDALDRLGAPDDTAADAVAAGHRLLADTDDEW